MEWKYAESYPGEQSCWEGSSGRRRLKCYRPRHQNKTSCLDSGIPLKDLLYNPIYQIVRMGWLGDKMVEERVFHVSEARVVVVCPEENWGFREYIPSPKLQRRFPETGALKGLLPRIWRNPAGITMTSPRSLLTHLVKAKVPLPPGWAAYISDRYDF
jgi:hypothetical protein